MVSTFNRSVALNAFATLLQGRASSRTSQLSIAQSRSMPLPHLRDRKALRDNLELSIAQSRSMPLPRKRLFVSGVTRNFQSLSRAQCLCHDATSSRVMERQSSFNRSVALNAFATIALPLLTNIVTIFQSLSRAQCLCHNNRPHTT